MHRWEGKWAGTHFWSHSCFKGVWRQSAFSGAYRHNRGSSLAKSVNIVNSMNMSWIINENWMTLSKIIIKKVVFQSCQYTQTLSKKFEDYFFLNIQTFQSINRWVILLTLVSVSCSHLSVYQPVNLLRANKGSSRISLNSACNRCSHFAPFHRWFGSHLATDPPWHKWRRESSCVNTSDESARGNTPSFALLCLQWPPRKRSPRWEFKHF